MKKVVSVLLFVVAVSSPGISAFAVDITSSDSFYVEGLYDHNHTLQKNAGSSSAFYAQKLRVTPVFQVMDGLTLTTRFGALSRTWQGPDNTVNPAFPDYSTDKANIAQKWAYLTITTRFGKFDVGYQSGHNIWGTSFGATEEPLPQIKFTTIFDKFTFVALAEKQFESDIGIATLYGDLDNYVVAALYREDAMQGGMRYKLVIDDTAAAGPLGYKFRANIVSPYFKANLGKAYVEGQFNYLWGEWKAENTPAPSLGYRDYDVQSYSWYLMGKYTIGPAYVGAMYAYVRGDDPETDDLEGTEWIRGSEFNFDGGADWNPCLILWNSELAKWMGDLGYAPDSTTDYAMMNASLYQFFLGASPIQDLSLNASYTYARANEKQGRIAADYGQEVDLTATYRIYDTLDYMVGFGYLFTGDWFKGAGELNAVDDDYLLLNRLTLNF